jgi:hypothetical protein
MRTAGRQQVARISVAPSRKREAEAGSNSSGRTKEKFLGLFKSKAEKRLRRKRQLHRGRRMSHWPCVLKLLPLRLSSLSNVRPARSLLLLTDLSPTPQFPWSAAPPAPSSCS